MTKYAIVFLLCVASFFTTVVAAEKKLHKKRKALTVAEHGKNVFISAIDTHNEDIVKWLIEGGLVDVNYTADSTNPANNVLAYAAIKAMSKALQLETIVNGSH